MSKFWTWRFLAVIMTIMSAEAVMADDSVYANFPVTLKDYSGSKTNSVSYTGQIARHVLHDSLKKLAGSGNGSSDAGLKAQLMGYYRGAISGDAILAPKSKGNFIISQTRIEEISKGKNLSGKTYRGTINGMPNGMTGAELIEFWIDKASSA